MTLKRLTAPLGTGACSKADGQPARMSEQHLPCGQKAAPENPAPFTQSPEGGRAKMFSCTPD